MCWQLISIEYYIEYDFGKNSIQHVTMVQHVSQMKSECVHVYCQFHQAPFPE